MVEESLVPPTIRVPPTNPVHVPLERHVWPLKQLSCGSIPQRCWVSHMVQTADCGEELWWQLRPFAALKLVTRWLLKELVLDKNAYMHVHANTSTSIIVCNFETHTAIHILPYLIISCSNVTQCSCMISLIRVALNDNFPMPDWLRVMNDY